MAMTLLEAPVLNTDQEPQNQVGLAAWRCAQEVHRLSMGLLPMVRPVYRSWLKAQSRGTLKSDTQEEIFVWLSGLHPGQAESEYRLMLLEISWLEILTRDFFNFLSEAAS